MNSKLLIGIIVIVLVGVGGFLYINSRKDTSSPSQGHNQASPSAKSMIKPGGSYQLEVTSDTASTKAKQPTRFTFRIKDSSGGVFKKYEVAHEKLMHFIGVRKDLTNFLHLHPEYDEATGEFTVNIPFSDDGPYRLFPDFTPGIDNPDKQPVTLFTDVEVGNPSNYLAQSVVADTDNKKTYGDYESTFDFPQEIQKEKELTFGISIAKNGQPVTNLENYLGALGHSVILKEGTLDFIHTHALSTTSQENTSAGHAMQGSQNDSKDRGPKIEFSATFPKSGVYKIFTQFQHEGEIQNVDYSVDVK